MPLDIELETIVSKQITEGTNFVKRCKRCFNFYTDEESTAEFNCHFHTGKFIDPEKEVISSHAYIASFPGWSCCNLSKVIDPSVEPMKYHGRGCKKTKFHEEDFTFTRSISTFPIDTTRPRQTTEETDTITPTKSEPVETINPDDLSTNPDYIIHQVQVTDTLAGLAIRYNINKALIKKINKLQTDHVIEKKFLYFPKNGTHVSTPIPAEVTAAYTRSKQVTAFREITNCSKQEATYYLEDAGWNGDVAIKAWKDDLNWQLSQSSKLSLPATQNKAPSTTPNSRFCL